MISAIDPDKMDALCRRMFREYDPDKMDALCRRIKNGSGLEKKTCQMLAIDKHQIPFTGADKHNDNFVISGKPKGGTS